MRLLQKKPNQLIMKSLSEYIAEKAGNILGKGAEGTVYELPDNKIKKVFKSGKVPLQYQLLHQASKFADIQCLPKIYEFGSDFIVRDNLKFGTQKCKKYYEISQKSPWSNQDSCMRLVLDGHYWYDPDKDCVCTNIRGIIRGIYSEVIDWLARLKYELSQVAGEHAGLGDFAFKNLAETSDGKVVLADL